MMKSVSLQRRIMLSARLIAYSSALKMLALLGNRTVLHDFCQTTAEATPSPILDPKFGKRHDTTDFCPVTELLRTCRLCCILDVTCTRLKSKHEALYASYYVAIKIDSAVLKQVKRYLFETVV